MTLSKRDLARIERRLVATLTDACETAKAEITGFSWLTHEFGEQPFPAGLVVVWVFDTEHEKAQALAAGQDARMRELTALALADADVQMSRPEQQVRLDSEQECERKDGGDWQKRLARLTKGRS